MSKINVMLLRRKPPVYFEKSFPVPSLGASIDLRVTKNDALLSYKIQDVAAEQIEKYITEQTPFPPFGEGADFEITPTLLNTVAPVFVLQAPKVEADRYSFDELMWISVTESDVWNEIQQFLYQSHEKSEVGAGELLGNDSGVTPLSP